MTNPDNVGGLLPCPFCGGEAELVGGEQDEFCHWHVQCTVCGAISGESLAPSTPDRDFASESWNLRELCRAASAGGDVPVAEVGELNGTKLVVGRDEDALARLPKGTKLYTRPQDSAPDGSGEVGPILIHAQQLHLDGHMDQCALDELTALLRKLQQGADASVPRECPSRFRCDCLGACKYGLAGGGAASQGQEADHARD